MNKSIENNFDYKSFFQSIRGRVLAARVNYSRLANREANNLYWFIGKTIVENQEKQGWGANLLIINKIKDVKAREYYLQAVVEMGWTRNILALQIDSQAYERHCLENKTHNFEQALPKYLAEQADPKQLELEILKKMDFSPA